MLRYFLVFTVLFIKITQHSFCTEISDSVLYSTTSNLKTNKFKISDSSSILNKRKTILLTGISISYAASMTTLYNLWYKGYKQSTLHTFNDSKEWFGMDKLGHSTTSYYVGQIGYETFRWAGYSEKKSIWIGGSIGLIYLTTIELFDGVSENWGFSWTDMGANTFGTALFISQQQIFKEQRIRLKWSYHSTKYPKFRPNLLGKTKSERILKDYNGQTYWLSGNISSFFSENKYIPKWLNISCGYGAEGMIGANSNPNKIDNNTLPFFKRYNQIYISPDIDFTKIKTKNKTLKFLFKTINFIKFPLPTIEFNTDNKTKFYYFYF